jgi:glycogen(starch) synthase
VAPSRAMAAAVAGYYGVEACTVVLNGRSGARFRRAVKEPVVFSAGRLWDEGKNVAAVARAAAQLPWPVFVAGEHRHPNGTAARFQGCTMLGQLAPDDLAGWYARAAIYALPARYEPFGFSALEAALSGCALVLGDIPSLREVWGDAAVFVEPDDSAALGTALRRLIDNPSRREAAARAAMERALEFTPQRMAEGYLETYRTLASARRKLCAS